MRQRTDSALDLEHSRVNSDDLFIGSFVSGLVQLMRHDLTGSANDEAGADGAETAAIAASTVRALTSLFAELKPLVGALATQALYRRALHLARASFALPGAEAPSLDEQLERLRKDLAGNAHVDDARRSSEALLHAFVDLLVSLIGGSLTFRLLRSAWGASSAETYLKEPAQ